MTHTLKSQFCAFNTGVSAPRTAPSTAHWKHPVNQWMDEALFMPEVIYKPSIDECLASHLLRKYGWGPEDANAGPSTSWICSIGQALPLLLTLGNWFLTKWVNGCGLKGQHGSRDACQCTVRLWKKSWVCCLRHWWHLSSRKHYRKRQRHNVYVARGIWLKLKWFLKLQRRSHLAPVMIRVEKAPHHILISSSTV